MLKTLLRLITLVLLPLYAVLFYQGAYNPITMLSTYVDEPYLLKLFGGSFELIEHNVMAMDAEQRQARFSEISDLYGTKLVMQKLDDLELSNLEKRRLAGHRTRLLLDPNHQLARLLPDEQHVIVMYLEEQEEQRAYRQSRGTFALVSRMIQNQPQAHWEALVQELQSWSPVRLALIDHGPREHAGAITNSFSEAALSWYEYDNNQEVIFIDLANSNKTLMFGPIPSESHVIMSHTYITGAIILAVISVVLGLWLVPVWKNLNQVKLGAREFGRGHLDSRVKIQRNSVVAQVGDSFNRMADRIQNLIKTNQFLTNAVAHDLRTPLARLRFAHEMLSSGDCSREEKTRYKNNIEASIEALEHLINQSITYSRYDRSADARRFATCCFAELIRQEVEQIKVDVPSLLFSIKIDPELEKSEQLIDKNALRRALSNLLGNAMKHATSQVLVTFSLSQGDSGLHNKMCYVVAVDDDGEGVEEQDRARIFEPFVQVNNEARDATLGHGFGLAIVSKVAEWHGGVIMVEQSETLNGASFRLSWPVDFAPEPSSNVQ